MLDIHRLEPSEFHLLKKIGDGFTPDPKRSVAIVARNDVVGIIGRIFLVSPAHVEGVFVDKPWRNTTVLNMLVKRAELEAFKEGLTQLLVFAKDAQMADYIKRLGYKELPLTVWSKELLTCQRP
jgi:N-acetylglutamate synthase-like GNAT family acetyltransferase